MSWDEFQREALAELGLSVYALAGAQARIEAPVADEPPSPLLLSLLCAAAADISREDALVLCREFLAANPKPSTQARRELWPKLRRLRAIAA